MPRATFTTDLMVGFPGESREDFLETVEFARRARFLDAHVFAYSRREGTPAADYPDQIPEDEKHLRSEELIKASHEVRDSLLSEIVDGGEPLSVIAETHRKDGTVSAHSDTYVEVSFKSPSPCDLSGELVTVRPVSHKDGIVYAEFINFCK